MAALSTVSEESRRANRRLAVVVGRFPCLTEGFVRNEIDALERHGWAVHVVSCAPREMCDDLGAEANVEGTTPIARTRRLPERRDSSDALISYGPRGGRGRVLSVLLCRLLVRPRSTIRYLAAALRCVPLNVRGAWHAVRAVSIAVHVESHLRRWDAAALHGHFLHLPALVAVLLARSLGVPVSVSAHARDVFIPEIAAEPICSAARFVSVCSDHARAELLRRLPPLLAPKVVLCHHGLNLEVFPYRDRRSRSSGAVPRLVSVCRLVPKKGIDVILRAVAVLRDRGTLVEYDIVGDGPERGTLAALGTRLNLASVRFLRCRRGPELRSVLASADAFALGCRQASDGDRDGIPNAILEAMALGIPVVVGRAGGVVEVVRHLDTGWLVRPDDPASMADAIEQLLADNALRERIVRSARREVEERFDWRRNVTELVALMERPCDDQRAT